MTAHVTPSAASPSRRSARAALAVFAERRTLVMMALGFAAGLPYLLIFDTLSAWLRQEGLSLQVIGFFSLATLVSSFKFLWAPVVDRIRIPVLTVWLGHRRSWMLACQAVIVLGLALISGQDPKATLGTMAALAVLVGFSSATQDIVIDAWRIEVVDTSRQGAMAAAYSWGYRGAMIVAGAVPLLLADSFGWNVAYGVMVLTMALSATATLLAPREAEHAVRSTHVEGVPLHPVRDWWEWAARLMVLAAGALLLGSGLTANASVLAMVAGGVGVPDAATALVAAWRSAAGIWYQLVAVLAGFAVIIVSVMPVPGARTLPGTYLSAALGDPLRDFFKRYGRRAGWILALICLYRLSDFVLNIMNPFYLDLGFTLVEVAEIRKVYGVIATLAGIFAGGYAVARIGLMRSLLIGALAGPLSNLVFLWLATRGHDLMGLFLAIGSDNVMGGFSATVLIAYMSSLTTEGFTATQYAMFSSLYALPGRIVASQSGRIVESAAHSAEAGGAFSGLRSLFENVPSDSFAGALAKSGVSPASLASGYAAFFLYSCAIGVFAIVLTIIVVRTSRTTGTSSGSRGKLDAR
jgi:PAT family beta-lactamase induction signal transducer AmpG